MYCLVCKKPITSTIGSTTRGTTRLCPEHDQLFRDISSLKKAKQDFFGASPNIFVGRFGYPAINVGMLSNEDITSEHDNPKAWASQNYTIPDIIARRTDLINSRFRTNIKTFSDKLLEITQEVAMAHQPVDVEINLAKPPSFSFSFGAEITPYGPAVELKKAAITQNPKIPRAVETLVADTDAKATSAIHELYDSRIDEYHLTKLLSAGTLGQQTQRRLVPTRWAITAVDDILAKRTTQKITAYDTAPYHAHFGGYLGNYFLVLFFEGVWSYELFEVYVPDNQDKQDVHATTDHETHFGRKDYAQETAGGYYAARLSVAQHLEKKREQAGALVLRFITAEYWAPLGVWVVREAVRKALQEKPRLFDTPEALLLFAKTLALQKFRVRLQGLLSKSILLRERKQQKRLSDF
ncbi:hypothetical protein COY95_01815 [Candidatus Woesearchaeota archaeon CG_4_10_14_0_8_um_filter_47_5]|nr:MAG: hypothetical protein COY95_01815 [Candidatus Woesearchaeota archaeon CG_4_10_14_0_8_um_filter_47_5]